MSDMRRRDFIMLLGGAAAWPLATRAQQPAKLPTIGYLGGGALITQRAWVDAFVQRLRERSSTAGTRDAPSGMPRSPRSLSGARSMSSSRRGRKQS
jgi:hypothetical protein